MGTGSFPIFNRSRLRAKRNELYKRYASTSGTDTADTYNDDDIYGEQEHAAALPTMPKEEESDMLDEKNEAVGEEVEAWLCTCSEQGVFKVSTTTSMVPSALPHCLRNRSTPCRGWKSSS